MTGELAFFSIEVVDAMIGDVIPIWDDFRNEFGRPFHFYRHLSTRPVTDGLAAALKRTSECDYSWNALELDVWAKFKEFCSSVAVRNAAGGTVAVGSQEFIVPDPYAVAGVPFTAFGIETDHGQYYFKQNTAGVLLPMARPRTPGEPHELSTMRDAKENLNGEEKV